jgi:signal transduction histidine kinase
MLLLLLAWAGYQLRIRRLHRQFEMTLDARVAERTRIARDLHDTLLQSFHGLLLRFQTAFNLLPDRPAESKQVLASAIDQAAEAITEGRDAVQGLRASATETNDLAESLRALAEDLANEEGNDASLHIEVQGTPRALHPIVRDEVFRIAGEALRNAFHHSGAKQIEVELRYNEWQLRVRVRDDGKGIDPEVLRAEGREGHFGLGGMRERAKLAGGTLTVWSGLDAGTEVELSIPGPHAYGSPSPARSWLAQKIFGQNEMSDS